MLRERRPDIRDLNYSSIIPDPLGLNIEAFLNVRVDPTLSFSIHPALTNTLLFRIVAFGTRGYIRIR